MSSWTGKKMPDYPQSGRSTVKPLGEPAGEGLKTGDILGIPASELMDAVSVLCAAGCGLLISPTSDGGALSVTVYASQQRHRGYATSATGFSKLLLDARDVAEAHLVGGPARAQNGTLRATR